MKFFKTLIAMFALSSLLGCGLFSVEDKEDPAKKRKEDSLAEIDRTDVLNNADKLLKQADSIEQAKKDSINKISAKK